MADSKFDVVVVGGGLSGLSAARRLRESGLSVVVLEARDRLGGRTCTVEVAGQKVDVGGQWIGPGQDRVLALIEELGVSIYPQHHQGSSTVELDGEISRYRGFLPKVGAKALLDLGRAIFKLERGAKRVPTDHPWNAPDAKALDSMSVEDWTNETTKNRNAREVMRVACNAILAEEPANISWLHYLFYASGAGGFTPLAEVRGGAQQDRISGGAQQLSEGLSRLSGAEVRLSEPVTRIAQQRDGVAVTTHVETYEARFAVIALAPPMCDGIAFDPPLPEQRRRLQAELAMGSVCKCIVGYDRPFWRDRGISGEGISNGRWARLFFDATSPGADGGALVAFVFSDAAKEFGRKPEAERRQLIVEDLRRLYGPEAGDPRWYVDKDWSSEIYSGGCYAALFARGQVTELGPALRKPVGLLHFAGTETATRWVGYMDGALQAGVRAAEEILARD
ncbi:MAG: flavin monoamine oxidase family protein [Myxococcota bacterium]